MSLFRNAVVLALVLCGCPKGPVVIKGPVVTPVKDARWRTMQAQHSVTIDAAKGDGREQISVSGLISVEQPDRFRLRAVNAAGMVLFELLKLGGDIKIIKGVPGVDSSLQEKVLFAIGADLSAAYDLEPRLPSRNKTIGEIIEGTNKEGELRVTEPERVVRLQRFKAVRGQSIPTRMEIRNNALDYNVVIEVLSADLDQKLDPALFQAPAQN